MGTHIGSGLGSRAVRTFALLDQLYTVLGATKATLWPFTQSVGATLSPYGSGNDGVLLTAATAIESIHDPFQHAGGIYSLKTDGTADADRISAADNAAFSFAGAAFSVGAWVLMEEALGTARSVMSKYRTTAASAREFDLRFSATGFPILEIYDESVPADWTSTCTVNVLTPFIWQFVVATYSGTEGASAIIHYLNGTVETPVAVETGLFVATEDTSATLCVGSRDQGGAAPAQVLQGRIALPFITGKTLTSANVTTLKGLGDELLGL